MNSFDVSFVKKNTAALLKWPQPTSSIPRQASMKTKDYLQYFLR